MEGSVGAGSSSAAPPWLHSLEVQPEVPYGANNIIAIVLIKAGEGIGEKVQSYFENRENFPSRLREHTCLGVIVTGQGTVSSPTMEVQGSVLSYEGSYYMTGLSGFYSIPKDGPVQLYGGLRMCFVNPDGELSGGSVIGSLVAALPIQVTVLAFIQEDTIWSRLPNVFRAN